MATKSNPLLDVRNPRGRFRFSISTLLLLTLTAGVAAGWWSDRRQLYSRQLDLQHRIRQQATQILAKKSISPGCRPGCGLRRYDGGHAAVAPGSNKLVTANAPKSTVESELVRRVARPVHLGMVNLHSLVNVAEFHDLDQALAQIQGRRAFNKVLAPLASMLNDQARGVRLRAAYSLRRIAAQSKCELPNSIVGQIDGIYDEERQRNWQTLGGEAGFLEPEE